MEKRRSVHQNAENAPPVVEVRNVSKRFGGVQALADVSFAVAQGTVHALLGENGAGKSTLVKILCGAERADEGTFYLRGQEVDIDSPQTAKRLGISVVHQELTLFPDMSVRSNVFAGQELHNPLGFLRGAAMDRELARTIDAVGWTIDSRATVSALTLGERQMVEILRAFYQEADLIILDEPNSALTDRETNALFAMVERMRGQGRSFLLVSHRLDEVFAVADAVTVLRDGRHVATLPRSRLTMRDAVTMMVGDNLALESDEQQPDHARGQDVVLEVSDLGGEHFSGVTFHASRGEILGFAGLEGSGLQELFAALFGLARIDAGQVLLEGSSYRPRTPGGSVARGIASIPADRKEEGLVMDRSVGENTVLVILKKIGAILGFVTNRRINRRAMPFLTAFRVRTPSASAPVTSLSGGNQQKVVLAKWLASSPRLLILNDPTRGIDVGAKREVHAAIHKLAGEGITVLVWSSDAAETLDLCDRVLVMRRGRLVEALDPRTTSLNQLLLAIVGAQGEDASLHKLQNQEAEARSGVAHSDGSAS
jgi:ribose transport system ATP-binding protein